MCHAKYGSHVQIWSLTFYAVNYVKYCHYSQVFILPQMAKILEKLQLQLNDPDLKVKNNQHAFILGRSTVFALISITQKWYDATDNSLSGRKGVHAVF